MLGHHGLSSDQRFLEGSVIRVCNLPDLKDMEQMEGFSSVPLTTEPRPVRF